MQQETGEFEAAETSHRQALELFRQLDRPLGEAEALNRLGELATRTSATGRARELHSQALAIARELELAFEEARALEGLGQSYLQAGNGAEAAGYLQQALTIYERIGVPGARRVEDVLNGHGLAGAIPATDAG